MMQAANQVRKVRLTDEFGTTVLEMELTEEIYEERFGTVISLLKAGVVKYLGRYYRYRDSRGSHAEPRDSLAGKRVAAIVRGAEPEDMTVIFEEVYLVDLDEPDKSSCRRQKIDQ